MPALVRIGKLAVVEREHAVVADGTLHSRARVGAIEARASRFTGRSVLADQRFDGQRLLLLRQPRVASEVEVETVALGVSNVCSGTRVHEAARL
ncbi:MAG: hypothetical protein GWN09_08110 [Gammaproteobacteria bacterium]|nr:hypothetical protein [Gammaproteobacteria bacterium]